jgi:plasmid stabilization system protein ParE
VTLALRWTNAARQDLLDIWAWRGRDHPDLGDAVLGRIEAACMRLTRVPHRGGRGAHRARRRSAAIFFEGE